MISEEQAKGIEILGKRIARGVQDVWLRYKFAAGLWKGIMIHADWDGKLTDSFLISRLNIVSGDPEYQIRREGKEVLTICPRQRQFNLLG